MDPNEAKSGDRADQDLTILLTLKDRAAYTLRWMDYANSAALPFKVLIADGSLDDAALTMLTDKARFPNVDYEYVRYPPDRSYADYYTKMADALVRVRTPFVVMADNDDFFVVNGLRKAVHFLSTNSDYIFCGGQGAIFWIGSSPPEAESLVYGGNVEWKCTRETRSIDGNSARARLRAVSVSKSDPFYYDVKRSDEARKQLALVRDLNLKDLFLVAQLLWDLAAIAGKTKRLDTLYLARQQNSPGSSGGNHEMLYGDWLGRMLVPSWSDDFAKFLGVVTAALAKADGISDEEARRHVIASYRASVAPSLLSNLMDEPTVTISMSTVAGTVRRLVKLPADSVLKRLSRTLYRRLKWVSPNAVYGTELRAIPVSDAEHDFKAIREFLTRSK